MVEASKSKSMNKYLESKNFLTIEEKAVSFFVKQKYFFGAPCSPNAYF